MCALIKCFDSLVCHWFTKYMHKAPYDIKSKNYCFSLNGLVCRGTVRIQVNSSYSIFVYDCVPQSEYILLLIYTKGFYSNISHCVTISYKLPWNIPLYTNLTSWIFNTVKDCQSFKCQENITVCILLAGTFSSYWKLSWN